MSIQSTVSLIRKFAHFDWKVKSISKIATLWSDAVKKHYLY
jgi:hypothetical protein